MMCFEELLQEENEKNAVATFTINITNPLSAFFEVSVHSINGSATGE